MDPFIKKSQESKMIISGITMLGLELYVLILGMMGVYAYPILYIEEKAGHEKLEEGHHGHKSHTQRILEAFDMDPDRFFFIWIVLWLMNTSGAFMFWIFQDQVGISKPFLNSGIYVSALVFWNLTVAFSILWIWTTFRNILSRKKTNEIVDTATYVTIIVAVFSVLSVALMYSICRTPTDELSHSYCWVPGLLNTPYLLLFVYLIYCLSRAGDVIYE